MANVFGGDLLKNAGLQGGTFSNHMTTGFGPSELPTCGQWAQSLNSCTLQVGSYTKEVFKWFQ